MADQKISELTAITGANSASDDVYVVVDTSTGETKKITRAELFKNTPALDVTGTATMDGLSNIGSAYFYNASGPEIQVYEDSNNGTATIQFGSDDVVGATTSNRAQINMIGSNNNAGNLELQVKNDAGGLKRTAYFAYTGDVSFYEATGTTAKFFWDASAESLTLGTGSSTSPILVLDSSYDVSLLLNASNTGFGAKNQMRMVGGSDASTGLLIQKNGISNSAGAGAYIYNEDNSFMALGTNNAERMRLDASGNLLVGQSTSTVPGAGNTTLGHAIRADGGALFSRAGGSNATLYVNKNTDDGTIIDLRKDGTTVGSIGANTGDIYFTDGVRGFKIQGYQALVPTYSTGGDADAVNDIGGVGKRWANLYLSGGVYVGGTGAANYLDDYEEGTFTPTISGGTTAGSGTYSAQVGEYTKIGNTVFVSITLAWSAHTGTGIFRITNLPFSSGSSSQATSAILLNNITYTSGDTPLAFMDGNRNFLELWETTPSASWSSVALDTSGDLRLSLTYRTA